MSEEEAVDTGEEVQTESDEESTETQEPIFSQRELSTARKFGLSEDALAALGDNAKTALEHLVKVDSNIGRKYAELGHAGRKKKEVGPEPDEPIKLPEELADTSVIGEGGVEFLKGLAQFKQAFEKSEKAREEAEAQRFEQGYHTKADEIFAKLDPDAHSAIGGGLKSTDLLAGGPEAEKRNAIVETAINMALGHYEATGNVMDTDKAIAAAIYAEYPDAVIQAIGKQKDKDSAKRRRQLTHRATGATGKGKDAREATMAALGAKERELGVNFFVEDNGGI